jgi:2-polyprenyl-6-methoxyphenol hydroxylase-like FAD-dependent oxidoreductase
LKEVPKTMIVIGGGVIGLEMGSVWSRLGANVTVVEYTDTIVPSMDAEVRRNFQRSLTKQGFKFKMGTKVAGAEVGPDGVTLTLEPAKGGDQETIKADYVLVATGAWVCLSPILGVLFGRHGHLLTIFFYPFYYHHIIPDSTPICSHFDPSTSGRAHFLPIPLFPGLCSDGLAASFKTFPLPHSLTPCKF